VSVAVVVGLVGVVPVATEPAGAAPVPLDLTRPRILGAGADLTAIADRVSREPYETVFRRLVANARAWDNVALDDDTIAAERIKSRAAKDQAFLYAIDRTIVDGEPAQFRTPAHRQEAGDTARTLLSSMYTRSRLAVPAPLGGHDRDINTSEELLQYATAYDTLLGAGYAFTPEDEATIRTNITDLAAELYENYTVVGSAGGAATVLPNNHRSKSAAALGVAALALLDTAPPQGAPPADFRAPAAWLAFAIDQVDLVQRWTFVTPDGGYGEGPYYQRYAGQNLLPFARAWSHANHAQAWDVGGRVIPDLWTSAVYRQTQRWVLDTTLPNGALAPIDDGNVDFSYYFGAAPTTAADAPAFAWRWANAPTPYDTEGSIDLSADSLIAYDDSVVPAPPPGSPTRFSAEAGTAVFRSGWDADATQAVVLGEHGAAMELGRDREGNGKIASAAHEQPDTGSFSLGAYGRPLLLDPGYLTYEQRGLVGKASDHNLVLVDGKGPLDPFLASIQWVGDLAGLPPVDGQATISDTVDTALLDTARVASRYAGTDVSRRFFFVDDSYLVVADTLQSAPGTTPNFTWPLHGNGGGTSGGTFEATPSGGRWTNGAARLDAAVASDGGPVSFATREANHESTGRALLTHTALDASSTASGPSTHGLLVAYPSRSASDAPTVQTLFSPRSRPRSWSSTRPPIARSWCSTRRTGTSRSRTPSSTAPPASCTRTRRRRSARPRGGSRPRSQARSPSGSERRAPTCTRRAPPAGSAPRSCRSRRSEPTAGAGWCPSRVGSRCAAVGTEPSPCTPMPATPHRLRTPGPTSTPYRSGRRCGCRAAAATSTATSSRPAGRWSRRRPAARGRSSPRSRGSRSSASTPPARTGCGSP
jgi:hypothetical protein